MPFTHLDDHGHAIMVDIAAKAPSLRIARAEAWVIFPAAVYSEIAGHGNTAKGNLIETANIAGILAAKRTSELIPLCHPLMLEKCQLTFRFVDDTCAIHIESYVSIHHKTGVEMEALTAVSVAALTIYDMCKALSHDIVVNDIRLCAKSGGRRDFQRSHPQNTAE